MTGPYTGGILRAAVRFANTGPFGRRPAIRFALLPVVALALAILPSASRGRAAELTAAEPSAAESDETLSFNDLRGVRWGFGRETDRNQDKWPDGFQKTKGIGYPNYIKIGIVPRDPEIETEFKRIDQAFVRGWQAFYARFHTRFPTLPAFPPSLPDSTVDAIVDRYLSIILDGGQAKVLTPPVEVSRLYQYRFKCEIMTRGLRHDSALAELVFLDANGQEIQSFPTRKIGGTTTWTTVQVDRLQPPPGATSVIVRLMVQRAEDGLEDIRGEIGFDSLRIDQYPQLQVTTNEPLGIYFAGQPVEATARVMGLPIGASKVRFRLYSSDDLEIATRLVSVVDPKRNRKAPDAIDGSVSSDLTWRLPRLENGYYRIAASLEGKQTSTLSTDSTFAIIDQLVPGPPHGSFGWTLADGHQGIKPRDLAQWLAKLGVAWVKYPCWLAPEDDASSEYVAMIFSKLQDSGIQTVGMLDVPPDDQVKLYNLRGRREMVASQLFRDTAVWQPLLEPIMTRLTLKVRTWQLGADRDHSFLGRPRLRESVKKISLGLQGFGQPIDVAISWPWLETQLGPGESSWQAICRSSDPGLGADELDAFLGINEVSARADGPRTWLLLDPVSRDRYDRDSRIRDLILRMATVRNHRVQAAFVSDPRDPAQGLLRTDGRPSELLLPWRTTSRLIGNLRNVGSLQLRSGAANAVFADANRAVMMVWSAKPSEERIYLGENVKSVDAWGRETELPIEMDRGQAVQRVKIGPIPTFLVGADPTLLAFRMSVALDRNQLDSLLGQVQPLTVSFTNPTREGLVGDLTVMPPQAWTMDDPKRDWETLGGRSNSATFNVVLGNSAKIGMYEVPIRFDIQTVPPKRITVHRWINVGPKGLEINVETRLSQGNELQVQIEITNRSDRSLSYDCMLFPPPGRQYQRRFLTVKSGETIRRSIFWSDGADLVGQKMLLRAVEQDGRRVVNFEIDVRR